MASKTVGKEYWIGAARGGIGYFVKNCPHCGESIYLEGEYERNELAVALPRPGVWTTMTYYMRQRVRVPRLTLDWGPRPVEADRTALSERLEVFRTGFAGLDVKAFNRDFFERKHADQGGVAALEEMIMKKTGPSEIGRRFGISPQRAGQIIHAYREAVAIA